MPSVQILRSIGAAVAAWLALPERGRSGAPAAAGPMVLRYYTLMHIAMFDAVNSIQRRSAKLWAAVEITNPNLMRVWDYVVRDVTLARRWSLMDAARLFAFVNVSINDSLLDTFTGKFSYGLWRPITATRRADEDLNDVNGNPNVTREYSSLSQLAQEEADSRIFAGIHFRFDNEVSQVAATSLSRTRTRSSWCRSRLVPRDDHVGTRGPGNPGPSS